MIFKDVLLHNLELCKSLDEKYEPFHYVSGNSYFFAKLCLKYIFRKVSFHFPSKFSKELISFRFGKR